MRRRLKALETRLGRIAAKLRGWEADAAYARECRDTRALVAAMARAGLAAAGIDPDTAAGLRRLENPAPAPRYIHPLRAAGPQTRLDYLRALTARFHRGPPPDLRNASPFALVGYYCFGDGAVPSAGGG